MTNSEGPRKPRGTLGTTTFRGKAGVEFNPVTLPRTKEEIERFMIDKFARTLDEATRERFEITGFSQIQRQADLDCRVHSKRGDFTMELTELVPVDIDRGGHDLASPVRSVAMTADKLLERIREKSKSYNERQDPWLLVYFTAWQLSFLDNEITLVQRALVDQPPRLGRIYLLDVTDVARPLLTLIYPMDAEREALVRSADIPYLHSLGQLTANPDGWRMVKTEGSVGLHMLAGADKAHTVEVPYTIKSVIVCDDVRQESNGKAILIGVYDDTMTVSAFPAVLPQLCFRIAVDFKGNRYGQFTVIIHDHSANAPLTSMTQPIGDTNADETTVVIVEVANPKFSQPTTISILFGADREPEEIGHIAVRLAGAKKAGD